MGRLQADVLVIGGGATGAGVAWDAALRGFDVILVERGDLAEGTSGRFHGLLHSGGRYVVKDPVAADECVVENATLRRVIPDCIEDTGGLFVTTPDDDPAVRGPVPRGQREGQAALRRPLRGQGPRRGGGVRRGERDPAPHHPRLHRGHRRPVRHHARRRPRLRRPLPGGLPRRPSCPAEEIDVAEALRREPRLNPGIKRAFTVPDASIDAWKTVWSLARGASAHGARILTYHRVIDLHRSDGAVTGARVRNELTGEELDIEAGFMLNASGAWAAQIAAHGGHRGRRRGARQGDHDRHEPPAGEHGDQPLHDAGRRRHPRAGPDGQRDRHDRHPRRRPGRDPGHPGRGRPDARRRRAARARLPRGARAARVGGRAAAVPGRQGRRGRRHARRQPHARRGRPPRSATASTAC